jgi:uncharacterized protein YaaQ
MKLVIAIVHDEDTHELIGKLNDSGFGVTKLASTGGFLRSGNTTILIGVAKEKVEEVLKLIGDTCKTRKEVTTTTSIISEAGGFMTMPIEVTVGGATIFVVDVEQHVKF